MHTLGAQVANIVHPAVCLCVLPYMKGIDIVENACTGL